MTRHRELLESPELAAVFPIFADAEQVIADPVVRNRGTIGGSLCQADPSEDLTAVCTALDAELRHPQLVGRAGGLDGGVPPRSLRDGGRAGRDPHRDPAAGAPGWIQRLRQGRAPSRRLGRDLGRCRGLDGRRRDHQRPRRAGGGRAQHRRHPGDLGADAGQQPSEELYEQAGELASANCSPSTDNRGTVEYKRHLADELTRRTLRTAVRRIEAGLAGDQGGNS